MPIRPELAAKTSSVENRVQKAPKRKIPSAHVPIDSVNISETCSTTLKPSGMTLSLFSMDAPNR